MQQTTQTEEFFCPRCSQHIVTDYKHGEKFCPKCGLVVEEALMDNGKDWSSMDTQEEWQKSRMGNILKFYKKCNGLTTEIDKFNRDSKGRRIPSGNMVKLCRIRRMHSKSTVGNTQERNFYVALPILDKVCSVLHISKQIQDESACFYRKCVNDGTLWKKEIGASVAAIVYLLLKQHKEPLDLAKVANAADESTKSVSIAFKSICRMKKIRMPVSTPQDYLPCVSAEFSCSGEVEGIALELLEKAQKTGEISGRHPKAMAIAAVYVAMRQTNNGFSGKRVPDYIPALAVQIFGK